MAESSTNLNLHTEARARVEADVSAAVQESFEANATHVQTLENGTGHLTLFVEPRPLVIAQVDIDRSPIDDRGNRTTIMSLTPVASVSQSGRRVRVGNGKVHANVWRLTESSNEPPRFETGELDADGSFAPFDDTLMAHDETVASFGGYWPANLRQGSPESPIRQPRGFGRFLG